MLVNPSDAALRPLTRPLDFAVIGAAKSGTTALYGWLRQQSGVFLPEVKEPHFYCFAGSGPDQLGHGVDPFYARQMAFTRDGYARLYADAGPCQITGDVSPGYLYFPQAAGAIHADCPQARIICILRNPADRAFSQYMHHRRDGMEPLARFEEALAAEAGRIAQGWWWGFHYRSAGFYAAAIRRYAGLFPPERMLFLLYDDLVRDPQAVFAQVTRFLGVQVDAAMDFGRRVNQASNLATVPRWPWLHRMVESGGPVHAAAKRVLPGHLAARLRRAVMQRNQAPSPRLADETRMWLLDGFAADIEETARLIGRDLSGWMAA